MRRVLFLLSRPLWVECVDVLGWGAARSCGEGIYTRGAEIFLPRAGGGSLEGRGGGGRRAELG